MEQPPALMNVTGQSPKSSSQSNNKLSKQELALLKNPKPKIADDMAVNTGGYASSVENLEANDQGNGLNNL